MTSGSGTRRVRSSVITDIRTTISELRPGVTYNVSVAVDLGEDDVGPAVSVAAATATSKKTFLTSVGPLQGDSKTATKLQLYRINYIFYLIRLDFLSSS